MQSFYYIIILTFIIEAITVFFRFGLGLQATQDTSWLAAYTYNFRIHHGYLGLLLVVASILFEPNSIFHEWSVIIGWAMFLSDIIHHFLVLWPITGSHQFDIKYPKQP